MKTVLAAGHLQIGEGTLTPDGKAKQATFEIDTDGLQRGWTQLLASCSAAPKAAGPVIAWPASVPAPAQ
jgi:hypothetical protein